MKDGFYLAKLEGLHFPKIVMIKEGVIWYGPFPNWKVEEVFYKIED